MIDLRVQYVGAGLGIEKAAGCGDEIVAKVSRKSLVTRGRSVPARRVGDEQAAAAATLPPWTRQSPFPG